MNPNIQLTEQDREILEGIARGEYFYDYTIRQYVDRNNAIQAVYQFDGYLIDGLVSVLDDKPGYEKLVLTDKARALLQGASS